MKWRTVWKVGWGGLYGSREISGILCCFAASSIALGCTFCQDLEG